MNSRILRTPRARWCLAAALCTLVAAFAAVGNERGYGLFPPTLRSQSPQIAGATTQAIVDNPGGTELQNSLDSGLLAYLTGRSLLLSELMTTPPVLTEVAHEAGVAQSQLSGSTSYVQNMPEQLLWPDFEVRASQIIAARAPYQLNIQPDPNLPRFEIYARAPTAAQAQRLANSAVPSLREFLRTDAIRNGVNLADQFRIEQLGTARGAVINAHAKLYIVGLTFIIAFALCAAALGLAARVRRGWRLAASRRFLPQLSGDPRSLTRSIGSLGHRPAPARPNAPPTAARRLIGDRDDWPHTTRILPWMVAGFLFILWLVPFDVVQIGRSLPIDLKLDRVVLPVIVLVWILALASGGRGSPRVRLSWVHAGVFTFAAFAGLSLVIGAHYLNETLQLDAGVKRLALLIAYVTFFVVIASVIRRSEVHAFLRYTLVLAVVAAIGTIIEYRFKYNVFYDLTQRLSPGFQVGQAQSVAVDDIGRRLVRGPAGAPLEAVAMFTMALPIALVGITDATRRRSRLLYGLAAALLLAAAIATERKSGLVGPLAVILTVAFFRRRQLVRLAPLAVVLLAVVKVVAPGAIGSVVTQLQPSQLGVDTVADRVIRYDAIRPDVWLHLAFGQGFGTYTTRVLDNELLGRLVEGGVLGLASYILMLVLVVGVAIGVVRRREPEASTVGLVAASAAVAVLVLSTTYDWIGFPHGPYIFFSLAGLLAVVAKSPRTAPALRLTERPRAKAPPRLEEAWSS